MYVFVNKERKKVAKNTRIKAKKVVSPENVYKGRSEAAEYVGYLLELHKLQGVLLNQLNKKV
jgi:hypothetical protein